MERTKKVPSIRFPEFLGEWVLKKLGDVSTFSKGKGISKADIDKNGKIEFIRYGELYTCYGETIKKVYSRTNLDKDGLVISEYNDVIIPASGETQLDISTASCVLKSGIALGGDINIIKSNIEGVFLSYYLNNRKKNDIASLSQGVSVVHLYSSQLKLLELNLPSNDEQQKISDFVSSIDTRIEKLTRKKELLDSYKKGTIQKLFSQEIRFKDDKGNDYPEWDMKMLSKFLIPELREVEKPSISYLAIGVRSHCKGTFQKPDSNPEKIAMDKLFKVKENDLIVNITFAWEGAIAIVKKEDTDGLVSHRFPTYVFNEKIVKCNYFKYVFIQKIFRTELDIISPGGAGRNRVLSKKDFLKIKCRIPCIEEQTKIANFLTEIDKKISIVEKQLKGAKEYKKGLLQQMFV